MKRIACALLCLLLALPGLCRAEDAGQIDIAALMARQVSGNSAFRAQLTAELSEAAPAWIDAALWRAARAAAADTALETSYVFSRAGETLGNSQAVFCLKRGEETLSTLRFSGRGGDWQVWGDALGDTLLTLPRDTSLLLRDRYLTLTAWGNVLLRGLGFAENALRPDAEGQWPALYRFLTGAVTEDAAWREQVSAQLKKYTDQVSSWLQEKTKLYLAKQDDGQLGTTSEIRLDGAELKAEALALLDMLYHDNVLLALLRGKATQAEAQAYLEPGMILLFEQVLTDMTLPEDMTLLRRYRQDGSHPRLSLRLPLADGAVLVWENAEDVDTFGYEKGDLSLRVSVASSDENAWQGDFALRRGDTARSGQYRLFASLEPVYEDEDSQGRQRRQKGTLTLLLFPDAEKNISVQSLTVTLNAWAGLQNDQPAHWNAQLDWQEADSGAYARVSLKTRTGAALAQSEAEGAPLDLAALNDAERGELLARIKEHFAQFVPAEND